MSDTRHESAPAGADNNPAVSNRAVELAVALFTAGLGAVIAADSYRQGIGWNDAGPEAGYFPFYIGLIMSAASLGTIALTIVKWRALATGFVARGPLRHVLAVFVPICIYLVAIRLLGMYIASPLFIGWFMWRDREERGERNHGWLKIVLVPLIVVAASYLIFERWFQVPLYAGPVFEWLGIGQ